MFEENNFFEGAVVDQYFKITEAIPHYESFHDQLASYIESKIGDDESVTIIDLGCGGGWLLKKIQTALPNVQLIGVDSSDTFYNSLSKDEAIGLDYFKYDILTWLKEQSTESIDVVVSSWVFHNWSQEYRKEVFKEVSRVLKYNGMFLNADKIASKDEVANNKSFHDQIKIFIEVFSQCPPPLLSNWILHYIDDEKPSIRFTEAENDTLHILYNFKRPTIISRTLMECISSSYKI
jgi:SAM-dependent methyltransferase